MVLLTSGTISAAISSGIVFLFTSALFLSGYVIQQKTVNSLREQIREPPRPTHTYLYLPPQFANPTPTPEAQPPEQDVVMNPDDSSNQIVLEGPAQGEIPPPIGVGSDAGLIQQEEIPAGKIVAMEADSQIPIAAGAGDEVKQSVVEDDPSRSLDGLSRAERRKRIKEEIFEATRKDREGYHRRTY